MADIRVNGKRVPPLQAIDTLGTLIAKLDTMAAKERTVLTSLSVNNSNIDIDNPDFYQIRLASHDTIEALFETQEQLSLQSLQIAKDMAELLIFDIKVATISLWDNTRSQLKSLEALLGDCKIFLTLGARPAELLGCDPYRTDKSVELCLRQLDKIADNIEDAILLATAGQQKDSCHVLVGRVMPAIEKWLEFTDDFATFLKLDKVEFRFDMADCSPVPAIRNDSKPLEYK